MSTIITFENYHVFSAPYVHAYMYMGQFPRKRPITYNAWLYKCYNISLRLNHYNFRIINAIDFLFSKLHTTPFLNGKIHFGALHLLCASIATSNTPPGQTYHKYRNLSTHKPNFKSDLITGEPKGIWRV